MHTRTAAEIEDWIKSYILQNFDVKPGAVGSNATFDELGLDSLAAVNLVGDLEAWLGEEVDPALPYDFPTLGAFAQQVAAQAAEAAA